MATILSDPRASGAPRSAQPGGYKVDISRGERIGRVSSEWFSRPDDERYLSLSALHDAVLRRAERATARTVETRDVRVDLHHRVGELFKLSAVLVRLHRRLAFRPGATGIATSRTTPRVALCPAR